jgi:hypothetical protein
VGTPATFPPPPPPSCPCAGTPAWSNAVAAPADSCDVEPGFADFFFAGFRGEATVSDNPSFGFCSSSDQFGNSVEVDNISPADADLCLAQIHAVACP